MIGIYKITNPEGKVYIGASKNIKKRWEGHRCMYAKSQRKLMSSFKEYGVSNHVFEIIEECSIEELDNRELFFGLEYNVLDKYKGLNLSLPKDKKGNGGFSKEANIKATKGCFKKGITPWNKGVKTGKKAWNNGKKFSEASKLKMSNASKGQKAWNRRLIMCEETGIFFNSSVEAAENNRYSRQSLNNMLSGKTENKTSLRYV